MLRPTARTKRGFGNRDEQRASHHGFVSGAGSSMLDVGPDPFRRLGSSGRPAIDGLEAQSGPVGRRDSCAVARHRHPLPVTQAMEDEFPSGSVPQRLLCIDEVLERTDLGRLLDELTEPAYGGLRGRRWHCPLPAHDDRHPSVSMFTDRGGHQRWRCWRTPATPRPKGVGPHCRQSRGAPAAR